MPPRVSIPRIGSLAEATVTQQAPPHWLRNLGPAPRSWAWVLSGGGALGAFQVGAALRLMRDVRYRPKAIASTSVGSINALALAEGDDAGAEKLRDIWLALEGRNDMYEWAPWVIRVEEMLQRRHGIRNARMFLASVFGSAPGSALPSLDVFGLLNVGQQLSNPTVQATAASSFLMALPGPFALVTTAVAVVVSGAEELLRTFSELLRTLSDEADGLWTFEPLRRTLERNLDLVRLDDSGIPIRFVTVGIADNRVFEIQNDGVVFVAADAADGSGVVSRRFGLHEADTREQALIEAAFASSSIPLINPPIEIRVQVNPATIVRRQLLDGGVRETLPVRSGLSLLRSLTDRAPKGILAISTSVSYVDPESVYFPELRRYPTPTQDDVGHHVPDISLRAFTTLIDETLTEERRQVSELPSDVDSMLIAPTFTLESQPPLDPGATQLLLSYGYMSAFDAWMLHTGQVDAATYRSGLQYSTNVIMQARYLAWRLEAQGSSLFRVWPDPFPGVHLSAREERGWVDWIPRREWDPEGHRRLTETPVAMDFDWLIANDRLAGIVVTPLTIYFGRPPTIRHLKKLVRLFVNARVANWGLESLPDVHDLSNLDAGNVNHLPDWWRRFERHGFNPDTGMSTGPGLLRNSSELLGLQRVIVAEPDQLAAATFGRPRSSPWDAALAWSGEPLAHGSRLLRVDAEGLPRTAFEREPDWGVVRLEGYVLTPSARGLAGVRTVELTEFWHSSFSDHWLAPGVVRPAPAYVPVSPTPLRIFGRQPSAPRGTVPLATWFSPSRQDHLTTSDLRFFVGNPLVAPQPRATLQADYGYAVHLGWIFDPRRPQPAGTLPLWRWFSPSQQDFRTTADPGFTFAPASESTVLENRMPGSPTVDWQPNPRSQSDGAIRPRDRTMVTTYCAALTAETAGSAANEGATSQPALFGKTPVHA